jgi:hypothetical protein
VPFLIMHGTADPTVAFQNGLASTTRSATTGRMPCSSPTRAKAMACALANRKDLTVRYFQFFDHYLKGAPAPKWITDGVPYLQKGLANDAVIVP